MQPQAIGIDVGGTKTLAVRIRPDGTVTARLRRPTPRSRPQDLMDLLDTLTRQLRTPDTTALGVALPGLVDAADGTLRHAPGFDCDDLPVRSLLQSTHLLPVYTDNDARAAAWAEHRLGAGRGHGTMVLITAGTGWGCGMVVNGLLLHGSRGFAGEVGHLTLVANGPPCYCGRQGCAEVTASGSAITGQGRASGFRDGEAVTRAADAGDERAVDILRTVGRTLGQGAAVLVGLIDPEIIVVGGGAVDAGELLLTPARASLAESLLAAGPRPDIPPLVRADLGNDAGALGIALLALSA